MLLFIIDFGYTDCCYTFYLTKNETLGIAESTQVVIRVLANHRDFVVNDINFIDQDFYKNLEIDIIFVNDYDFTDVVMGISIRGRLP